MLRKKYRRKKNSSSVISSIICLGFFSYIYLCADSSDPNVVFYGWGTLIGIILLIFCATKMSDKKKELGYLKSQMSQIDQMTGVEFEQYLKANFEEHFGFKCYLTPKTNDYGADLILEKNGEKIAIQAKRYKGNVGIAAVQEVIAACSYYGCDRGIVVTNSFFTNQAINLAKESVIAVELWNRDRLKKEFEIK